MSRIYAVANQKGGVAKTTTTHALGAALVELGQRVLVVDLDPQACLTYSAGLDPDLLDTSLHDVVLGRATVAEATIDVEGLHLLGANIDLAGAEIHLVSRTGREYVLKRALAKAAARAAGARTGPFVTVSTCTGVRTVGDALHHRWGALCESMEGAAAAHVCALYRVPFLEVRGVSNLVEDRDREKWQLARAVAAAQDAALQVVDSLGKLYWG